MTARHMSDDKIGELRALLLEYGRTRQQIATLAGKVDMIRVSISSGSNAALVDLIGNTGTVEDWDLGAPIIRAAMDILIRRRARLHARIAEFGLDILP